MWLRTRPASASIFLEARTPTKDRPATQETVSFDLIPLNEVDHLDLDTGEVFQDPSYARLHKNEQKLIGASITINPLPDDSYYQYNDMSYFEEVKGDYSSPSSIFFSVFIVPTAFRELVDNIRNGLLPETITIELSDNRKRVPLQHGWQPDGSGMVWHNIEQENRRVPIKGVLFGYAVVKAQYDEKHQLLPMQSYTLADRINEQIAPIQTTLAEMSKQSRWTMMGVVALVVIIVWFLIAKRASF
jgi:hypothetical protein